RGARGGAERPLPARPGARRIALRGRGVALLICGVAWLVVGLMFGRSDAVFGAVTLLGAVAGSWLGVALSRLPLWLTRTLPPGVATRGAAVTVALTPADPRPVLSAAAPRRGASGSAVRARLARGGPVNDGRALEVFADELVDPTPWGPAAVSLARSGGVLGYVFAPPERGVFQIGPARLTVPGPLGLVKATWTASGVSELVVAPALVPVEVTPPDPDREREQLRSTATAERVTDPTAVRDYQSGDPRRLVHWKATARRDRLMVRETVTRGLPDAWVLVDDAVPASIEAERALEYGASVALRLLRSGHTVRLVKLTGREPPRRFDPAGGADPVSGFFARLELAGVTPPEGKGRAVAPPPTSGPCAQNGETDWVARFVQDLGSRGATGPVYGALARADADLTAALARAAALADPATLWLVGEAADRHESFTAAGWLVTVAPPPSRGRRAA
ncbi:MAG: DUF58 domain-containing protein, partial [Bifidobacteriaceae bacterium]|nr:DUF58 domain-containing protein [Bifidobacteriaceae bacterium]